MINQVDFEGYLTRAWEYREQRFMRLANHRPGENGKMTSDYVTVQIDPSLDFDPKHVKIGRLLRVTGRIVGRDIVEPLKMVVTKSHEGVELPGELSTLVIRRPTVQILATGVRLLAGSKSPAKPKAKAERKEKSPEKIEIPPDAIQAGVDLAELLTKN
jgi:hypothetical protein